MSQDSLVTITTNAGEVARKMALTFTQMQTAIRDMCRQEEKDVLADFQAVTATWEHKPQFRHSTSQTVDSWTVTVSTDDEIFGYVERGTQPHAIMPRDLDGVLAFQWSGRGSYKAKTRPRVIKSYAGGPSGPMTFRRFVWHPGTEPREFTKTILQKYGNKAPEDIRNRVWTVLRDHGW